MYSHLNYCYYCLSIVENVYIIIYPFINILLIYTCSMRVASIFVSNRELSPGDLLGLLAAEFGTVASSEAKIASSSMGTRCRENEPIVRALSEIAQVNILI